MSSSNIHFDLNAHTDLLFFLFSSHLWVTLSSMYGKFLVLLMLAFCLTEVMDNSIRPLAFQGIFMMYLYVGSIIAIMCIYITVLLDNCPSVTNKNGGGGHGKHGGQGPSGPIDPEVGSIASFGTLRRAHIDRRKVSRTSFYLRVGALGKSSLDNPSQSNQLINAIRDRNAPFKNGLKSLPFHLIDIQPTYCMYV